MPPEEDSPTHPVADDHLISMSEFASAARQFSGAGPQVAAGAGITTLSPSLLADLDRFENAEAGVAAIEVMAACLRHARPLVIFLELGGQVLPLRLFPNQGIFACSADMLGLTEAHVRELRFVRVEPGVSSWSPAPRRAKPAVERTGPLLALSWQVAMHGSRFQPLPEIDGRACYRVSPVLAIARLPADADAMRALRRMQRESLALDEIAAEPGIGIERACRLLNAVYLQAGLITLRTSAAAKHSRLRSGIAGGGR